MSEPQQSDETLRPLKHYSDMEYVCENCGKVETFDGLAVAKRSPFADDDEECVIHTMVLSDKEAYWNGDKEPEKEVSYV